MGVILISLIALAGGLMLAAFFAFLHKHSSYKSGTVIPLLLGVAIFSLGATDVSRLSVTRIEPTPTSTILRVVWPSDQHLPPYSSFDVFGKLALSNHWNLVETINFSRGESAADVEIQNQVTDRVSSAFFTLGTDEDDDGDWLSNAFEILVFGTDPNNEDTDGEGLWDGEEFKYGTDPLNPDTDGDGLTDYEEIKKRTNPFIWDTDGDGVSDLLDPYPRQFDDDINGQDENWVHAYFCADEDYSDICELGYPRWVDSRVGTDQENGLYKLTITVPFVPTSQTEIEIFGWLPNGKKVDTQWVNVTYEGEYYFLLYKGLDYTIEISPHDERISLSCVDDVPSPLLLSASRPRLGALRVDNGSAGEWTIGGDKYVCVTDSVESMSGGKTSVCFRCNWLPRLVVDPPTARWDDFLTNCHFSATLQDYAWNLTLPGTSFAWREVTNACPIFAIKDPTYSETDIGLNDDADWQRIETAQLLAIATLGSTNLVSELKMPEWDIAIDDLEETFDVTVPTAILLNTNETVFTKIEQIKVVPESRSAFDGTLTIACTQGDDKIVLRKSRSLTGEVLNQPMTIESADYYGGSINVYAEGIKVSEAIGDIVFTITYIKSDRTFCRKSYRSTVIRVGDVVLPDETESGFITAEGVPIEMTVDCSPKGAEHLLKLRWNASEINHNVKADSWWQLDHWEVGNGFGKGVYHLKVIAYATDGSDTRYYRYKNSDDLRSFAVIGWPKLVFDYDRDGVIDDTDVAAAESGEKTFRFWVNDDNDTGDVNDSKNDRPGSGSNGTNGKVDGASDLIDFAPVWIDRRSMIPTNMPDTLLAGINYRLVSTNFNAVWSGLKRSEVRNFQTDGTAEVYGNMLSSVARSATVSTLSDENFVKSAFSRKMEEGDDYGVFFVEGRTRGTQLRLEVTFDKEVVVGDVARICVSPVEEMYRTRNLRPVCGDFGLVTERLGSPLNNPDSETPERNLVFLHGANVTCEDSAAWFSEVFKRLWQSGANVRFHGVTWCSDKGPDVNYQENVSNAFVTASHLASYVGALPGTTVVMAHSLGNMVVSSAIQDYGMVVSRYLMCNSAVPAEAYDPDPSLRVPQLVHPDWEEYPTNSWASSWHWLFRNDHNDDRKFLGWPGRFADVAQYAVNFYSTGDEVLELAANNHVHTWTGISDTFGHLSWHKQELFKGRGGIGGTSWSGWNIDENFLGVNKISVEEAQTMAEADFKTNTVFYCYPSSMNQSTIPLLIRGAHLAQGIPALTPATGRTRFRVQIIGMDNGFDENIPEDDVGVARPNGWPIGRTYGERWCHSDMKDVAYFYLFKFYEKVIEKGGLK